MSESGQERREDQRQRYRKVVSVPVWDDREEAEGEILLRLDLGKRGQAAWGFGSHPTTSLCLSALLGLYQARRPGPRHVLDVGCGSGVLSLTCARLGAEEIRGIDIDAAAVQLALANGPRNGIDGCVFDTTPLAEVQGTFDLVIANVLPPVLHALREPLCARSRGGLLLLSGFKLQFADELEEAFTRAGLQLRLRAEREGDKGLVWGAFLFDGAPRE